MSTGGAHIPQATAATGQTARDISFSPLALPLLSGPGVIGLLIAIAGRSDQLNEYVTAIIALVALGFITYVCLRVSTRFSERLGADGLDAMTRVMGFIVLAIAVGLVAEGTASLVRQFSA